MFEEYSFDYLLNRMLTRVKNIDSNVDVSEGSLVYNSLAPAAWEMAENYILLDSVLDNAFADTADRESLIRRANEIGIYPKKATAAILKGIFNVDVPIGSRFYLDDTYYSVSEKIDTGIYILTCETAGIEGNKKEGILTASEYIEGLESAQIEELLIPGVDEEETEVFRERYRNFVISPAQDGNISQYEKWANEYPSIGISKVFPLWNGGNTVKVSITNSQFLPAEQSLVTAFQNSLDPGSSGLGNGVAPIGSQVTVTGGTKKNINISANIVLASGYSLAEGAEEALVSYLASVTYVKNSVSYMRIGSALLDCQSIADINSLKVNDGVVDIMLTDDEIPVLENLKLTVVTV